MKKWYESSTILINIIGIIVLALNFIITSNLIPDPEVVALIVAILNILNRFRAPKKVDSIEKSVF